MLVFAHRGYHEVHPENTLAAFSAACDLGVGGIETDLRLSADGRLILFHDRLSPDGRPIGEVTRAELSAAARHDVPTAAEALDAFPDVAWNLEIKSPDAVAATISLIDRYRASHHLFVTSFWHQIVDEVATVANVECGLLVCHGPTHIFAPRRPKHVSRRGRISSIVWNFEFLNGRIVEQAKKAGYRNFVYGPVIASDHRHCEAMGVDGIITDRPQLAGCGLK